MSCPSPCPQGSAWQFVHFWIPTSWQCFQLNMIDSLLLVSKKKMLKVIWQNYPFWALTLRPPGDPPLHLYIFWILTSWRSFQANMIDSLHSVPEKNPVENSPQSPQKFYGNSTEIPQRKPPRSIGTEIPRNLRGKLNRQKNILHRDLKYSPRSLRGDLKILRGVSAEI